MFSQYRIKILVLPTPQSPMMINLSKGSFLFYLSFWLLIDNIINITIIIIMHIHQSQQSNSPNYSKFLSLLGFSSVLSFCSFTRFYVRVKLLFVEDWVVCFGAAQLEEKLLWIISRVWEYTYFPLTIQDQLWFINKVDLYHFVAQLESVTSTEF